MEQKKINSSREKKQKIVAQIADKVSLAKSLVFTNYQGLSHKQIEQLKKALKQTDAELAITKNTLLKLALKVHSSKFIVQSSFEGPTATLFIYGDPVGPLKQLAKTIKELNLPTIKLGIIEQRVLSSEEIIKLSMLPSREVLIAQFVGQMKAPIYGLHRALNFNIQKLVVTLKAIQKQSQDKS
ncbi:MAG: 50S ribosomal protein L10 [uncultured bacterium]|nr:MAG: 50S ribosomal protein L10 [uncultured bacterium]OGH13588.1 MAG: 50S ribosomal protein L10 [Candidatus Levybacteria bacterium RIFCSPHIGHO2_01_FULL_38_26]